MNKAHVHNTWEPVMVIRQINPARILHTDFEVLLKESKKRADWSEPERIVEKRFGKEKERKLFEIFFFVPFVYF